YSLSPCRAADTRNTSGPLGGPAVSGRREFPLAAGACGLPSDAAAVAVNVTAVPARLLGYLTLWAPDSAMPVISTFNSLDGALVSNCAIVPASLGSIAIYSTDPADLLIDITGYFNP